MERRGAERFEASSTIAIRTPRGRGEGKIADLSLAGCRLDCLDIEIARGDTIDLVLLEGVEAEASVCWSEGSSIGVRFAVPITMATLAYFRFAEGITVTAVADYDNFGRRLPPLGAQTGQR